MKFALPSWATTLLGVAAGVLAVLNQTVFAAGATWAVYITVALIFLAGLGISPLVGPAFRSALHMSAAASIVISAALAALAVAVSTIHMSSALHAALVGVIAFASALGFAPGASVVPVPTQKRVTGAGLTTLCLLLALGVLLLIMGV